MVTRFSVIPDERGLLLGLDKAGILTPGKVYEVHKILDQLIIKEIGDYALQKNGYPSELSEVDAIIYSGSHLVTKKELGQ